MVDASELAQELLASLLHQALPVELASVVKILIGEGGINLYPRI
jgi:hypothetical protein